jgi:hypothetical protein
LLLKLHRSSRKCCNRQDAKGMIWLYRGASAPRPKAFQECVIRLFVFFFVVNALPGSDVLIYEVLVLTRIPATVMVACPDNAPGAYFNIFQ